MRSLIMITRMKTLMTYCLLIAGFALASCTQPAPQTPPPPQFSHLPAINLAASEIFVVEEYKSPFRNPNVEHLFPTPPAEAVKLWVKERLNAAGDFRTLEVVIHDASVIETALPKTQGFKGLFTVDQSERYDATLNVTLKLFGGQRGFSDAETHITVSQSRTVSEDATLAEREAIFAEMTQALMQSFNAEAEANLRQYFSQFLLY